jgi:hypothetical protein
MGRRLATGLVAVAVLAVLAAGCGGGSSSSSNGEATKSGRQVIADARKAAAGATGVHVFGTFRDAGKDVAVDLVLGKDSGKGFLKQGSAQADVMRVGDTAYMRASLAFWRKYAGDAAAQLLHDRWLQGSATKKPFDAFAKFMSMSGLIGDALKSPGNHGTLTNLGEKTYKGQKVVAIKDSKDGSILYVASTGTPFPVAGVGAGSLSFDGWNKPVSVTTPKGAVDISSFG